MIGKNQEVLALAFKKAKAKSLKIKELLIEPDMEADSIDALIVSLSKAKASKDGGDWTEYVKGQRWYVQSLVEYSGLSSDDRLESDYEAEFPNVASYAELKDKLSKIVNEEVNS